MATWTYQNLVVNGNGGEFQLDGGPLAVNGSLVIGVGAKLNDISNYSIVVSSNWINSGTFTSSGDTVTFNATTAGHIITNGGSPFANVQFAGVGGYWTLQDSMTVTSTMTITSGTLDTKSGSNFGISVGSEWLNSNGTFTVNNSTVTWTGAGSNLRIQSNNFPFFRMYFTGPGSWQTDTDPVTISSHVIINNGTLAVAAGSTMTITGNVTIAASGELDVNNDMKLTGSLLNSGTVDTTNSAATFTASGTFTLGGSGVNNFPNITLAGNGKTTSLGGPITVEGNFVNPAGHTFTTTATNYAVTVAGNWTNAGTVTVNSSSVTFNGSSPGNTIAPGASSFFILRVNGSGGAWTSATNAGTVSSNVIIDAGTLILAGNATTVTGDVDVNAAGSLAINNNLTINGGDLPNAGTITSLSTATLTIASTGTLGGVGTTTLPRLTMTGVGQTTTLGGDIAVVSSMTIGTSHILDANNAGNYQIAISSYWANQGTFTARRGEVVFNSNAGLSGNTTFFNFTATTPGVTITFTAGSTQTVSGTLQMAGALGSPVKLRSSAAAQSFFKVLVSSWVSNVDVQFSNATGNTLYAGRTSTNTGNNTNWVFDYYPSAITDFSAAAQSDGTVLLTWSAPLDPDDNPLGSGSQYAIEWATYTVAWSTSSAGDVISSDTWHVYIATSGVNPGDSQLYVSTMQAGNFTYNFRIWTKDPIGLWSPISNSTSVTITPILSIQLSSHSYNFGTVNLAATTVSTNSLVIINQGNVTETYSLAVTTTGPLSVWNSGNINLTASFKLRFVLLGAFHPTQPSSSTFTISDIMTSTSTASSGTKFTINGSQTGLSVPPNAARQLWLEMDMPLSVSTTDQEQLNITVTATTP